MGRRLSLIRITDHVSHRYSGFLSVALLAAFSNVAMKPLRRSFVHTLHENDSTIRLSRPTPRQFSEAVVDLN